MLTDSTLRWRCRRGKKELDVLLGRFLDQHLSGLGPAQRAALERLVALEDEDLLDLILSRSTTADDDTATLLRWLGSGA